MEHQVVVSLPVGIRLRVIEDHSGWRLELHAETSAWGEPADDAGSGAAEDVASRWLVDELTAADPAAGAQPPRPGSFRVHRFARLPAIEGAARSSRIVADQTNRSVVVGERVVVKWLHRLGSPDHPALSSLAHLGAIGFDGVPATFGALTWGSDSGQELLCALVTAYLPEAADGWSWCVDMLEAGGPGALAFPAQLGRLAARLHGGLATPSALFPEPVRLADGPEIAGWRRGAGDLFEQLDALVKGLDGAPGGPDGQQARRRPSQVLEANLERMGVVLDQLGALDGPSVTVQRIHGDLHVGQVLRWSRGLAVIDFDGNPVLDDQQGAQPAARDLAQLLLSLDQVARIVDRRCGYTRGAELNAWSRAARTSLVNAYRGELAGLGRSELLDQRLLAPFLVEQICRDLIYAARFLPRWAYATIEGLDLILDELRPG